MTNRSDLLRTIWLTRPDLRALVEDDTELFELWCWINGPREYQGLAETQTAQAPAWFAQPAPIARAELQPLLTRLMHGLWRLRPDLQQHFALDTAAGQQAFLWWYVFTGVAELKLHALLTDTQRDWLNRPAAGISTPAEALPVTELMHALWQQHPNLQTAFNLQTPAGATAYADWYFSDGLNRFALADYLDTQQMRALMAPHPRAPGIPRILKLLHDADPDLRTRFPDPTASAFRAWASSAVGQQHHPALARLMTLIGWPKGAPTSVSSNQRASASTPRPFGVNLIGYARGQLGIGEDVRMAALALTAAAIPFSVYSVAPGCEVEQNDHSLDAHLSNTRPYAINLFCMTGMETARLAASEGSPLFEGRTSIGYWPWELPQWPADWQHAYNLVDELWASSRFTYQAYAGSCPKPLRHQPMVVDVTPSAGRNRADFGLPTDVFLFIFSFDGLSSLARKNPFACVRAFRTAFPRGTEPVGLVVKAMRAPPEHPAWQNLLAEAALDERIRLMDHTLARAELLDLYRACNCYVSLHRSEGFGRGMAEAMQLGKSVIATGYSGNLDFTVPGAAALVDYRLVSLARGDYPFGDGQTWAEPDSDHAAWWMRRLVSHPTLNQQIAQLGQTLTTTTHAPARIGADYAEALKTIVTRCTP